MISFYCISYARFPKEVEGKGDEVFNLASCRHTPDVGGYLLHLRSSHTFTSQAFTYLYNFGQTRANMSWNGEERQLGPGDSAVVKPFEQVSLTSDGAMAQVISIKIPGIFSQGVMHELATFAPEGLKRMSTDTSKWF